MRPVFRFVNADELRNRRRLQNSIDDWMDRDLMKSDRQQSLHRARAAGTEMRQGRGGNDAEHRQGYYRDRAADILGMGNDTNKYMRYRANPLNKKDSDITRRKGMKSMISDAYMPNFSEKVGRKRR